MRSLCFFYLFVVSFSSVSFSTYIPFIEDEAGGLRNYHSKEKGSVVKRIKDEIASQWDQRYETRQQRIERKKQEKKDLFKLGIGKDLYSVDYLTKTSAGLIFNYVGFRCALNIWDYLEPFIGNLDSGATFIVISAGFLYSSLCFLNCYENIELREARRKRWVEIYSKYPLQNINDALIKIGGAEIRRIKRNNPQITIERCIRKLIKRYNLHGDDAIKIYNKIMYWK